MTIPLEIKVRVDIQRFSQNTLNALSHRPRAVQAICRDAHERGRRAWQNAGAPVLNVPVRVDVLVKRVRELDEFNIPGACKHIMDGIFVKGVTPDDNPRWVRLGGIEQKTGSKYRRCESVTFIITPIPQGEQLWPSDRPSQPVKPRRNSAISNSMSRSSSEDSVAAMRPLTSV